MYQLAMLMDDVVVRLFLLDKSEITIGRSDDCDIHIENSGVSKNHARIRILPDKMLPGHNELVLEDLGSRNGTLVNDERVARCRLKPNDLISIAWNRFKVTDSLGQGKETTSYILLD